MSYNKETQILSKINKKREDLNIKFKTEICRNLSLGHCPFGDKCAFAHGIDEIRSKLKFSNYKTKDCKQFHELGYCQYGSRCQFKHREISEETASNSSYSPETNRYITEESPKKRLPVFAKLAPSN
ncbi:hypothetical protein SteCoe_34787 [Stentor coeruleus]|uniref:C3H1-type domain-containing protein n=1 Tax=Stentor coeruleus TaxID=5963 RepID=A0A1R2ATU1_9CILI|nr:hypothetical protein SteCoe_34787 [Stentor coeruleus]